MKNDIIIKSEKTVTTDWRELSELINVKNGEENSVGMDKKFSDFVLEDKTLCENGVAAVLHFNHLILTRCGAFTDDLSLKPLTGMSAIRAISALDSMDVLDEESPKVVSHLESMMMACKLLSKDPAYLKEGRYSQDKCNLRWEEYTLLKKIVHSNIFGKLLVAYGRWLSKKYRV